MSHAKNSIARQGEVNMYATKLSVMLAKLIFPPRQVRMNCSRRTAIRFNRNGLKPRTWTACTLLLAGLNVTNQSSSAYLRCRSGLFIKISNLTRRKPLLPLIVEPDERRSLASDQGRLSLYRNTLLSFSPTCILARSPKRQSSLACSKQERK